MKITIRDLGLSYQAYYQGNRDDYDNFLSFMLKTPGAKKTSVPGWQLPKCYLPDLENIFKEHIEFISNPWDDIGVDMKLPPYAYQKETIHYAVNNPNSLLVLPTGSGKTPIMIGIYLEAIKRGITDKPGIICVKASLKYQWVKEIEKFSDLRAKAIETPSKVSKKKFISQFEDCDLFVLNYETLNNKDVVAKLREKEVECILADEIHYVNSPTAKRTKSFTKFSDLPIKIGATATPITNNPLNLFAIFNMLKPDLFGHYKRFSRNYVVFDRFNRPRSVKNEDHLQGVIKPYVFIKTEEEIADQLPSLIVNTRLVQMTPGIYEVNNQLKNELKQVADELDILADKIDINKLKENEQYIQLSARVMMYQTFMQELADDPRLLLGSDSKAAEQYFVDERSPKLEALLVLIEEITQSGDKVCIFTKYERMQRLLIEEIQNAFDFKCAYVNGTMDSEERYRQAYDLFKDNDDYMCLIATNAMAEGVSLTECRYLIEYDLADSYAIQIQRHGRIKRANSIHRTGYVYQIILEESWDEIAQKIIEKKEKYDATLIKSLI